MKKEILISGGIPLSKLFGKDTERLYKACQKIMYCWLYKYKGCYIPENRPYPPFIKMWLKEHPEEKRKMELSRKEWEAKRDKQFRIVYGIAKKHHIYMEWCGKETSSCGDDWVIKKNGEEIGYLRVEDTLPL